jgi:hypothetical protein
VGCDVTVRTQKVEMHEPTRRVEVQHRGPVTWADDGVPSYTVSCESIIPAEVSVPIVDGLDARLTVCAVVRDGEPVVLVSSIHHRLRDLPIEEHLVVQLLKAREQARRDEDGWRRAEARARDLHQELEPHRNRERGERLAAKLLTDMAEAGGGW